jgi:DNA-binding transcriptional ArsR family regulator
MAELDGRQPPRVVRQGAGRIPSPRGFPTVPEAGMVSALSANCRRAAMIAGPIIAEVAALVADPARATIVSALLAGRALTASELALAAQITPQTASSHLGKLTKAGLLVADRNGRQRYFRLASPQVAEMIEGIAAVAFRSDHASARYPRKHARPAPPGFATTTSRAASVLISLIISSPANTSGSTTTPPKLRLQAAVFHRVRAGTSHAGV